MGRVEHLAHEADAAVLALHHMAKHGDDEQGSDTPLGSTAIEGGVDDTWLLRRYPRYRTIAVRGRHKDLDEHLLLLSADGTLHLGADRDAAELERVADELQAALTETPDPLTETGWLKLVRAAMNVKYRAMRRLVVDQRVRRLGEGTRGKPFRYAVAENAESVVGQSLEIAAELNFEV